MSLNLVLNESNLSTDIVINMLQNRVINLSVPTNSSYFVSKKYLDERLATAFHADQVIVDSRSSEKETVQQLLEKLADQAKKGFLLKSGGTMNAS